MNLYLSRLALNPLFAPALKLAADPYELHRRLLDTLPCSSAQKPHTGQQPKTAGVLFRVDVADAGPIILIQTDVLPDWDALALAPRALRCPPETKPYTPVFAHGQHLNFRILCQPVIRKSGQFGYKPNGKRMPGPRRACHNDEQRLEWLRRKAGECGFAIDSVGLSIFEWRNTKPLQAKGGARTESYEEARRRAFGPGARQRLAAVRFDGTLIVTDAQKLRQTLHTGIGTQKAFGFGLLSLAPVR